MSRFMVGDRVQVKDWKGNTKADFLLTGVVISVHGGGWLTVKHDDVPYQVYMKHKRRYDCRIGPRYDWQESDLTHLCDLLRFLDEVPNQKSA